MHRTARLCVAGLFATLLVSSAGFAADADNPAPSGVTSGQATGTNAAPNGSAQKAHASPKHRKKGSNAGSLGLSAGAIGAGAPGVAGKPGGESDVGHTSAPGTPNPHQ